MVRSHHLSEAIDEYQAVLGLRFEKDHFQKYMQEF
jgi:hypothetical protein